MASVFAEVLFSEEVDDRGGPWAESSQNKIHGFDWLSSGRGVETKKSVLDSGICVMTKNDYSLVVILG